MKSIQRASAALPPKEIYSEPTCDIIKFHGENILAGGLSGAVVTMEHKLRERTSVRN